MQTFKVDGMTSVRLCGRGATRAVQWRTVDKDAKVERTWRAKPSRWTATYHRCKLST